MVTNMEDEDEGKITDWTAYISNRKFAPIAAWVSRHHGALAELARRLSKRTGKKIHYQYVQQLLHLDPEKRVEPSYGMGSLLIRIARQMKQEHNQSLIGPYHSGPLKDMAYRMLPMEKPPPDDEGSE